MRVDPDALVVGPDDVLAIHLGEADEAGSDAYREIAQAIVDVGLGERALIFVGAVEIRKICRPGIAA